MKFFQCIKFIGLYFMNLCLYKSKDFVQPRSILWINHYYIHRICNFSHSAYQTNNRTHRHRQHTLFVGYFVSFRLYNTKSSLAKKKKINVVNHKESYFSKVVLFSFLFCALSLTTWQERNFIKLEKLKWLFLYICIYSSARMATNTRNTIISTMEKYINVH